MASNGIRDRVAIVGMGCTAFGERWDKSVGDLLVDAATEAVASAHIDINRAMARGLRCASPSRDTRPASSSVRPFRTAYVRVGIGQAHGRALAWVMRAGWSSAPSRGGP